MMHFMECRGDVFNLYFDIDLVTSVEWGLVDVHAIGKAIRDVLRRFFPGASPDALTVMMCTATSKTDAGVPKHGMHAICPDVRATALTSCASPFLCRAQHPSSCVTEDTRCMISGSLLP